MSPHPVGHPATRAATGPAGHPAGHDVHAPSRVDYDQRPMLVFWETTRACGLSCKHCRASATLRALPGELTHDEGVALIDQVAAFGRPYPILVLTGGDCLLRPDLFELIAHAQSLGIPTALSPSVTPALTPEAIARIAASGVKAVSISLDGALPATHDGVRGIPGHLAKTHEAIAALVAAGLTVQVNTTVMAANLDELPRIAADVIGLGAHIWEVFFLVHVGRGVAEGALDPDQHEDVCHFLYDVSHYGITVRTVEAPFFRRVVAQRRAAEAAIAAGPADTAGGPADAGAKTANGATYAPRSALAAALNAELVERLGPPRSRPRAQTASTRDGKGIVFVAHDGEVYPAGFLPLGLGTVREQGLADIYRDDERLRDVRAARFSGRCGVCEYADLCGGSRARAYAATGDLLAEDPACGWQPRVTTVGSPATS
ncbi:MAG: TIGR04053 family radical SAM/SPASM domain-containing protein [Kineosporiaceae bacterium]